MLLSFLSKASPKKFKQTIPQIHWDQVGVTIGEDWSNLFHDAEVFLAVCFGCTAHRRMIVGLIERNAHRIDVLPARLALMAPDLGCRHVEEGRRIGISQFDHVHWNLGAGVVAHFYEHRPDLLDALLKPVEATAARCLSQRDSSWYREATLFIRMLRQVAPQTLDRILSSVDVATAEIGWSASISKGGEPGRTAALLVESALAREDLVGDMARKLRARFPQKSKPRSADLKSFD